MDSEKLDCHSNHTQGPEDRVIGATVNQTGSFLMRAEKVDAETLLSQIVHMVSEAQRSRAPDPEARGSSIWILRSDSDCRGGCNLHHLGCMGTCTSNGIRNSECGIGFDHCMPMRTGSRDTDVHHGRRRERRSEWDSGQKR